MGTTPAEMPEQWRGNSRRKRGRDGLNTMVSVSELKHRGWTAAAIKKFLPEPDETRRNPHYCNAGAPMKYWQKARVTKIERTKAFKLWKDGLEKRKASAKKGVATRMANMEDKVETAKLTIIPGKSNAEILRQATKSHGGNYAGDPGAFQWSNRTAINTIRHCYTNYESMWSDINRGETGADAYETLRLRIDCLVRDTYPRFFVGSETDVPPIDDTREPQSQSLP